MLVALSADLKDAGEKDSSKATELNAILLKINALKQILKMQILI